MSHASNPALADGASAAPDASSNPGGVTGEVDAAIAHATLRIAGVVLFPLFIGLCAQVAFPIPPWGVPFSLQSLAVVLAALCLGPKLGVLSVLLYVAAGAFGVPLFSEGRAGLAVVLGQTGGYIAGFVLCQPVITAIIRRADGTIRGWGAMAIAVVAGHGVIFAIGLPVLYFVRNSDPNTASTWGSVLWNGMVVFLPGMVIKAAIAVWLGMIAAPWAARRIW